MTPRPEIELEEAPAPQKLAPSAFAIIGDVALDDENDVYDIIMYAENLGAIPPNTALMIVQVKNKRYEINVTSTEQTSGAVRFKLKR